MKRCFDGSQAAREAPAISANNSSLPDEESVLSLSAELVQSINAMRPISLQEMEGVALMNRIDTKYVLSQRQLHGLIGGIWQRYRVLEVSGVRVSPYTTLYFDTETRECFRQHHNGKLNRRKYRMREYKSSGLRFLEVKTKCNKGRTDKQRVSIERIEESLSQDSAAFIESVVGQIPRLQPQLWTTFSRVTLVSPDSPERVTVDWDLDFLSLLRTASLPRVAIVEVKQATHDRVSPVRQQLRSQGVRPMRISKYCLGSMLLEPTLKSNRFKKKLLAIERLSQRN